MNIQQLLFKKPDSVTVPNIAEIILAMVRTHRIMKRRIKAIQGKSFEYYRLSRASKSINDFRNLCDSFARAIRNATQGEITVAWKSLLPVLGNINLSRIISLWSPNESLAQKKHGEIGCYTTYGGVLVGGAFVMRRV
jgi:dihydroxyacetone kinase-like predicted kinase